MKIYIFLIFCLILVIPSGFGKEFHETLEIKMNQTVHFENLELYFYDIEDSRCPLDVTCIWEGNVTTMIHIKNQTNKISGYFSPGYTLSYFSPFEITLLDIQPHPVSTEAANYVATIGISGIESSESLETGETLGEISTLYGIGALVLLGIIPFAYLLKKKKNHKKQ